MNAPVTGRRKQAVMGSNVVDPIQVTVDEAQLTRLIELYCGEACTNHT